jgi:hypothetical protein
LFNGEALSLPSIIPSHYLIVKTFDIKPNEQPRHTVQELGQSLGHELILDELIAWLPQSTLNRFLAELPSILQHY